VKEANSECEHNFVSIDRKDKRRIMDENWKVTVIDGRILDGQNRYVVLKTRIFQILAFCEFAFRHSTQSKRQDRGLHQKTLSFRHNTEGCSLDC